MRTGLPVLGIYLLLMGVSSQAFAGGDDPISYGGSPANSVGVSAVAPNQAVNSQTASGSVYQSPLGGVNNNYQINNSQDTTLGFGPGIHCRGPNLSVSGFGTGTGTEGYRSSAFGGAVSLIIPLGNAADRACRDHVQEIVKQRRLDTAFTLVKKCAEFQQIGIRVNFDLPQFAHLRDCEGVTVMTQQVTVVQPAPAPLPPSKPIRGLW